MTTDSSDGSTVTSPAPVQLSRTQILEVTSRCLHEHGYDATTIRKIAGMLGCAVGSIYRYFTDKRELLSAVTQQTLEPVAAIVEAGGPFEQSVRTYHQLVTHTPETYRLMFWLAGPATDGPATTQVLPGVVQKVVDGWAKQLANGDTARKCWSTLHGFVLLGRDTQETLDALCAITGAQHAPAQATQAEPRVVITATEPPAPRQLATASGEKTEDVVML